MPRESVLRDREAVAAAVSQATSIAGALKLLGLRPAGGNYRALHQACERFGLAEPDWSATPRKPAQARPRPARIDWPADKRLRKMVAASSYAAVGRELGVSDTAVRKRLRKAEQSRLPGSNGSPPAYKAGALPAELRRPEDGRTWFPVTVAAVVIAGLAAGCALALAIRSGSVTALAATAGTCLVVLLFAAAGSPGVRGGT